MRIILAQWIYEMDLEGVSWWAKNLEDQVDLTLTFVSEELCYNFAFKAGSVSFWFHFHDTVRHKAQNVHLILFSAPVQILAIFGIEQNYLCSHVIDCLSKNGVLGGICCIPFLSDCTRKSTLNYCFIWKCKERNIPTHAHVIPPLITFLPILKSGNPYPQNTLHSKYRAREELMICKWNEMKEQFENIDSQHVSWFGMALFLHWDFWLGLVPNCCVCLFLVCSYFRRC